MSDWLLDARDDFCAGTGFNTPDFVVRARVKTVEDWCDTLGKYRVGTHQQVSPTVRYGGTKPARTRILEALAEKSGVGVGLKPQAITNLIKGDLGNICKLLVLMTEEGLLVEKSHWVGSKHVRFYRLAGAGEV